MLIRINDDLELELVKEEFAGEIFHLIKENYVYLSQWLPWVEETQDMEDTLGFIRYSMEQADNSESFNFVIKEKGEITGLIGLHKIDYENKKTAIGYWQAENSQGRGTMTLACKAILDFCFNKLNLLKIEIECATGNFRSQAIPARLNFTPEGIKFSAAEHATGFVDHYVYAMSSEQWAASKSKVSNPEAQ